MEKVKEEELNLDPNHIPEKTPKHIRDGKRALFSEMWKWVQKDVMRTNKLKGWSTKESRGGEMIALIHSEVSEILEAMRQGGEQPSEHVPEITAMEEEVADVIIRMMHLCHAYDIDLPHVLFKKMEYNKTRPYKHGGKLF